MEEVTVVKGTKEITQLNWVVEGWGYVYTEGDEDFYKTCSEFIELLCDLFGVCTVSELDALDPPLHFETAESYTFEGKEEKINKLRQYLTDCPTMNEHERKFADKLTNKLWEPYNERSKQYDLFGQDDWEGLGYV